MTCKDCLHYELCNYNTYEQAKYFGKDKEVYITIRNNTACKFFKASADLVPVVRCKDCKYWQDNNGGYPHEECRWGKNETPDADDFCSYGAR